MNMVGKHIIGGTQGRQAFGQPIERQAIGCINARGPQDGNGNAVAAPPDAQAMLGVNATCGTCALRMETPGFVDRRPGTIAVNTCRTHVNQAAW